MLCNIIHILLILYVLGLTIFPELSANEHM